MRIDDARSADPVRSFRAVFGQDGAVRLLVSDLRDGQIAAGYLLIGPAGVGKSLLADIFARAVVCRERAPEHPDPCARCAAADDLPDLFHLTAGLPPAVQNDILSRVQQAALEMGRHGRIACVIDDAHLLPDQTLDRITALLEHPPSCRVLIVTAAEAASLPPALRGRCRLIPLRAPSAAELRERLMISAPDWPRDAIDAIIDAAGPSWRAALQLRDHVMRAGAVDGAAARRMLRLPSEEVVHALLDHWRRGRRTDLLRALDSLDSDPDRVRTALLRAGLDGSADADLDRVADQSLLKPLLLELARLPSGMPLEALKAALVLTLPEVEPEPTPESELRDAAARESSANPPQPADHLESAAAAQDAAVRSPVQDRVSPQRQAAPHDHQHAAARVPVPERADAAAAWRSAADALAEQLPHVGRVAASLTPLDCRDGVLRLRAARPSAARAAQTPSVRDRLLEFARRVVGDGVREIMVVETDGAALLDSGDQHDAADSGTESEREGEWRDVPGSALEFELAAHPRSPLRLVYDLTRRSGASIVRAVVRREDAAEDSGAGEQPG
jgi:DNA polymerase III gamma/tau subunit